MARPASADGDAGRTARVTSVEGDAGRVARVKGVDNDTRRAAQTTIAEGDAGRVARVKGVDNDTKRAVQTASADNDPKRQRGWRDEVLGRRNRQVAELRRLIRKRGPSSPVAVLEGPRTIAEAVAVGIEPLLVAVPRWAQGSAAALAVLESLKPDTRVLVIADDVFDSLAPASSPQPMLAVVERRWTKIPERLTTGDLALVLVDVADPGNVGTIIRGAHACAARCVILVGGADPWAPKTVRSSSGSVLRVPVVRTSDATDTLRALRTAGAAIVATDARFGVAHDASLLAAATRPVALVLGSEARGLDRSLDRLVDQWVRIVMADGINSLNVAMAATLLAFEYRRGQRTRVLPNTQLPPNAQAASPAVSRRP